jgi:hypothetical protein
MIYAIEGRHIGPESINLYRMLVLRTALRMYANTGMRANRKLTPTVMLAIAGEVTGKKYRRGQHLMAADDLSALIEREAKE